jgi:hypothetical protein
MRDPTSTVLKGLADVTVLLSFTNPTGVTFGPQVGAGGEYLIDKNIAVTLRARVGPEFAIANGGTASQMGFNALLGLVMVKAA